ncbi:MAG: hypothetical protein K9H25_09835 [Rhodospirillum sp.]|nr:hypothetical protein [Rhodospirillum sp.]MCF8490426.1 hypothetical protein [Rhodospirillum sp.]MCF8500977.1 hypothetical protein [Rhodospirillum sp.]
MSRLPVLSRCLSLLLFCGFAAPALAQGSASSWETDFGMLELVVTPKGETTGTYPDYDGAFYGQMAADTRKISGVWVQPTSEVKCKTKEHGSLYWGRVSWLVTGEGELIGNWSFCDQPEGASGIWEGEMVAGTNPLVILAGTAQPGTEISDAEIYNATRFQWGQMASPDNIKRMSGDLTCDGVKDEVLIYLNLDSPDGPFLDVALLEPKGLPENMPMISISFGGDGETALCGEARMVDMDIQPMDSDSALGLTGYGSPLCNTALRLDDGMCDALWLFTMPNGEGMRTFVSGRN